MFDAALLQHLTILLATMAPALAIGVPLGVLCFRSERWQRPIFSALNIIQTVPSIALFGLLIAPLAGLATAVPWLAEHGVSGIGMAPAIVALVLYALLPLVRSVVAGLQSVPAGVIESATGMGLTRGQIFLRVQLPLALPLFLTGVRILAVQNRRHGGGGGVDRCRRLWRHRVPGAAQQRAGSGFAGGDPGGHDGGHRRFAV